MKQKAKISKGRGYWKRYMKLHEGCMGLDGLIKEIWINTIMIVEIRRLLNLS